MSDVTQSENPEPTPTCDTIDEQLEAFMVRFVALQDEALQYGLTSTVLICSYDPMDTEVHSRVSKRGNWFTNLGMIRYIAARMESDHE